MRSKNFKENSGNSKNRYRLTDKVANLLGLELNKSRRYRLKHNVKERLSNLKKNPKILVYDIETSRVTAKLWWTGKTYVRHSQIISDPKIISIAWKMIDEDVIHSLTWDNNHCDEKMIKEFLKVYNGADMVIGQNNKNFDDRWLNARALKHRLFVNTYVKSFDIMKQSKKLFRLISYSMDYTTKYLGTTFKESHEGLHMWDMIEDGTKEEQKEYLSKMVKYNEGDIRATEEMFLEMAPYLGNVIHLGVLAGKGKSSCPRCSSTFSEHFKTTYTTAGTPQHIMVCESCGTQFKISNKEFNNK